MRDRAIEAAAKIMRTKFWDKNNASPVDSDWNNLPKNIKNDWVQAAKVIVTAYEYALNSGSLLR